jgi:putative nucleotidyltransferase with HDIG domain
MIRVRLSADAFVAGTTVLGAAVLALSGVLVTRLSLAPLALLGAGVIATELLQVSADDESLDPSDAQTFSFSSGVHIAAILTLGPWAAALAAAFGVLVVDRVRGSAWRKVAFNAAAFGLAAAAAGLVFVGLGGDPGSLELPRDLPRILALLTTYRLVNLGLVSCAVALTSQTAFRPMFVESLRVELPTAAAEAGLGVAFAFAALENPWLILALAPLVLAVYFAHARLTQLRRETLYALETFANVVDERDAHTYRHSQRVAEYVRELAQELGLPASETARLRLAARLHDLGKIAVDADVLRKPAKLDEDEWAAMRRHARLSARLIRRFRFASEEARAVEYHHERYDGKGYYGIEPERIPLPAHFLIVADSFDAMTSERPYRSRLSREEALARLEAGSGTQFHPAVVRAFAALQRGDDPRAVLEPEELQLLRTLSLGGGRQLTSRVVRAHADRAFVLAGLVASLTTLGFGSVVAAVACAVATAAGIAWLTVEEVRARSFERSIREGLARAGSHEAHFYRLVGRLCGSSGLRWAALVRRPDGDMSTQVVLEAHEGMDGPGETALASWLLRETESREAVLVADGGELGCAARVCAALPLRDGDEVHGYLVLAFERVLSRSVERALRGCRDDVSAAFRQAETVVTLPVSLAAVS